MQLARQVLAEVDELGHGEVGRDQVAWAEAAVHELDDVEAAALLELQRGVARQPGEMQGRSREMQGWGSAVKPASLHSATVKPSAYASRAPKPASRAETPTSLHSC